MIDKGVGGGIMVCIIDVLREGGSGVVLNVCWEGGVCIIPPPHQIILLLTSRGWGYTIYIRYKTPLPTDQLYLYIRYGFLFLGLGV